MSAWLALAFAAAYPLAATNTVRQDRANLCQPGVLQEDCDADVEAAARRAFADELSRMFDKAAPGASADLGFEIIVVRARLQPMAAFPDAEVSARVTIRDPAGHTVDEIDCLGRQQIFERTPKNAAAGFAKAVVAVAEDLRDRFANSEGSLRWLRGRKLAVPESRILGPARGDLIVFADGGIGFGVAPDLHLSFFGSAGLAGRWFLLRGVVGTTGATSSTGSDISTRILGVELGPAVRLTRNLELHAGAGLNRASGTLTPPAGQSAEPGFTGDFARTLPSAFAGAVYVFPEGLLAPARLRIAVDALLLRPRRDVRHYPRENATGQLRRHRFHRPRAAGHQVEPGPAVSADLNRRPRQI